MNAPRTWAVLEEVAMVVVADAAATEQAMRAGGPAAAATAVAQVE